jgi:outer membrane protein assembly factor BamD
MRRKLTILALFAVFVLGWPGISPAPLIYRPGSGWETSGEGEVAGTSKAQLAKAMKLEEEKNYEMAAKAYHALVKTWPLSPNSAEAQYRYSTCLLESGEPIKAYKEFQKTIESYPDTPHFEEILKNQYEIGNMFLSGEKLRVWNIPTFPSMDKTVEIYESVIKNGPYSEYAPLAQMKIGFAREKQKSYKAAVESYENLIRKYPKSDLVDDAQFQIGFAYMQAAREADYDQTATRRSITAFQDYLTRYPKSEKIEQAQDNINKLRGEQARGLFNIARFYDYKDESKSALIYYNEVIQKYPESDLARRARERVEQLDGGPDIGRIETAPSVDEPSLEGAPPETAEPATPVENEVS